MSSKASDTDTAAAERTKAAAALFEQIRNCTLVDCSQPITPGCPVWPGGVSFKICPFRRVKEHGSNKDAYETACDIGTHIDTPSHFFDDTRTITDLKLDELTCPMVVLDLRAECSRNPDYELRVADLQRWERKYGRIPDGSLVCMRTGWGPKFSDEKLYYNLDPKGENRYHPGGAMRFPGFSADAAQLLATERVVAGIGIDTLSLDPGTTLRFPVHLIMLRADKYMIENMYLEDVPEAGAVVVSLPLKVVRAPEAQTRVMALVPRDRNRQTAHQQLLRSAL